MSKPITMNDLFNRYAKECIPKLAPRSQRDYSSIMVTLRQSFGHFAPADVKPRHIVAFLDVDKGKVRRNRMVTILSTVFKKAMCKWCIEDDLRNPCVGVERHETSPRTRYVTDEEYAAFRSMVPKVVQNAMDLALLTGQRQGDLVDLKWSQVKALGLKRDKWRLELQQGKTGKKLSIEITPALEAVLKRCRQHRVGKKNVWIPGEFVLQTRHDEGYTHDGFRAMWQRWQRVYARRGGKRFHFHDLRAKSASDAGSIEDAYARLGHISIAMTRRVYDRGVRHVKPLK